MTYGERPLERRSAVVAGSSRGIGRAVAFALATAGARVVVNGRGRAEVDAVVAEIEVAGHEAIGCVGSAAEFDTAGELIARCTDAFGAVDVLVNCVGVAEPPSSSILDLEPGDWRELIDAHLTATFNTCRHATPHMKRAGRGAIVNTSSHAFMGHYGGTGYPAGKGGTNSLTYAIAAELRELGVRANAVCPGARTRLSTGDEYARHIDSLHARGLLDDVVRRASLDPPAPEHLGPLYVFLASELSRGITGRVFSGAGGYVGVFSEPAERLLAYRDHEKDGTWSAEGLAEAILATPAFSES